MRVYMCSKCGEEVVTFNKAVTLQTHSKCEGELIDVTTVADLSAGQEDIEFKEREET